MQTYWNGKIPTWFWNYLSDLNPGIFSVSRTETVYRYAASVMKEVGDMNKTEQLDEFWMNERSGMKVWTKGSDKMSSLCRMEKEARKLA